MQPQTQQEKLKTEPVIPDYKCFIGYAATVYDAVQRKVQVEVKAKKGVKVTTHRFKGVRVEQGVKDLATCKADIDEIRISVARYNVTDMGRKNMYLLDDTPSFKKVKRVRSSIAKRLQSNPDKTFLLLYAFAGHGIQRAGKQFIVINTFDPQTGFYKMWGIEYEIRRSAQLNRNSYQIGLFACCREVFTSEKHSGFFGGTVLQALAHFDKEEFDELQSQLAQDDKVAAEALRKLVEKLRGEIS